MSKERSNHEKVKADLTRELESVLKAAISSPYTTKECISSEITQTICNVIEGIFIHGLKDPFFLKGSRYAKYPEPNFWPFVSKYSHRGITSQISSLKQIKTEIGKSRSWIRIVLNEGSLEHYVQLLLSEKRALSQFYNDYAYLQDTDQVERMNGLLKGLSGVPIQSATNSSFLNTWTPSPLILAGLVMGKPIKVSTLRPSTSRRQMDSDETGISALDMIPAPVMLSPIRAVRNRSRQVSMNGSDNDTSSHYSHPSLCDRDESREDRIFSSTPVEKGPLEEGRGPQNIAPLLVSRRTKRPRRSSRSSSESNSKGSREHSQVASTPVFENSLPEFRQQQAETMDSGIEAESGREKAVESPVEPASSVPAAASDEITPHAEDLNEVKPHATSRASDDSGNAGEMEKVNENVEEATSVTGSLPVVSDETAKVELQSVDVEISAEIEVKETSSGNEAVLAMTPTEQLTEIRKNDEVEPVGVGILKRDQEMQEDNPFETRAGTSLQDDLLSALSFSDDTQPMMRSGNSLMGGGGAWAVPRSSTYDADTSCDISSSSDSSGMIVSFGQALRTAMEQSPIVERRKFSVEADSEQEFSSRKSSILSHSSEVDDVDLKMTTIPREIGLLEQDLRCPMCRKSIGVPFGFANYGLCGMDGLYYCLDCHRAGGQASIPARVLLSWDWTPREVSDRGRAFIEANLERVSFDIELLNASLYGHVPVLDNIWKLRERLQLVSMYLFNCRESVADDFRRRIWPRDYLHNDIHKYSYMDLQNVRNGNLEKQLNGWLKHAISHVMSCSLCRQKGFVCEICNRREVIYPFNTSTTHRCSSCYSLFHVECASVKDCPKCARRAKYETREEASHLPLDC